MEQEQVEDYSDWEQKINFSFEPTEFFYIPRIVHKSAIKYGFQNVVADQDSCVKIYINPCILSYYNIDNILNLEKSLKNAVTINFESIKQMQYQIWSGKINGDLNYLQKLDEKDYYEPVYKEKSYRGGRRFIFKSESLSKVLEESLKKILPIQLLNNFDSVNPVFRYNCFLPQDNAFYEHYDIPYVDNIKNVSSLYTFIIYLTQGSNDKVLKVADIEFSRLQKYQFVIFSQRYKHQGYPFKEGRKVFIRTDLIYHVKNNRYNDRIASTFNTGCYMAKESIIDDELVKYSSQCFRKYTQMKFEINFLTDIEKLFLHKRSKIHLSNVPLVIEYMTDGTEYYFSSREHIKSCVAIILFDYFNSQNSKMIIDKLYFNKDEDYEDKFRQYFQSIWIEQQNKQIKKKIKNYNFEFIVHQRALPSHILVDDNPCGCFGYKQELGQQNKNQILYNFKSQVENDNTASLVIAKQFIIVNFQDLRIGDKIYFQTTGSLKKFNFASCQCGGVTYQTHLGEFHINNMGYKKYNLPYISYQNRLNMHIFHMDMFQNGYVIEEVVSQPRRIEQQIYFYYEEEE